MDNLMDFVCKELKELDRKAEAGNLSMSDMQYADTLAHLKKDLLAVESMEGYSGDDHGRSYGRNGYSRRYSGEYRGGHYSRHGDLADQLRDLMQDAPDDRTRQEIKRLIDRL